MSAESFPCYVGSKPVHTEHTLRVINKYTLEPVYSVSVADAKMIEASIAAAVKAQAKMRKLSAYQRRDILMLCISKLHENRERFVQTLIVEAGKTQQEAKTEVDRLIETFLIAAEEATRIGGEVIPVDITAKAHGYRSMTQRVPIGVCSFITPFNFPLNLVAHKIAPAIAAGCSFILKPASQTPISAMLIGEILAQTALPDGAFSILPCTRQDAGAFTTDERLKLLSFTGSAPVGWALKAKSGKKKVVLELGGNAACVVDAGVDVHRAVERIVTGAFYQAGQSCISVQRVLVHESLYDEVKAQLVNKTELLVAGDPANDKTTVGPVISEKEAERVVVWVEHAVHNGAKLLTGGKRKKAVVEPTILESAARTDEVVAEEVFGPVLVLSRFKDFAAALAQVNDSKYGLQAGVFTNNIKHMYQAWDELEVGGVVINDIPSWRVDNMPYGGVKDSGLGREGVKYAIEDMTEQRLLIVNNA